MSDLYPVIDGFMYASKQRCNLTFRSVALQEYDLLRRAGAYRQKTWLVPQDSTILIPAYDSYEKQLWMPPGSVIWGYSFVGLTGLQTDSDEPGTQSWQVRDGCDDVPLFSEVVTQMFQFDKLHPVQQVQLTKLLIIGPPGTLNVVICNTFAVPKMGQLVLYGGEPIQ
jgi:hypothetical protein